MRPNHRLFLPAALAFVFSLTYSGCDDSQTEWPRIKGWGPDGKQDASVEAVFLDFEFDGALMIEDAWGLENQIEQQLLYTVGQLNGDRSVSRLDHVKLSQVHREQVEGGYRVTYHARLTVAWGKRNSVPDTYRFILPHKVDYAGLEQFTEKYGHDCVDFSAHDVDANIMWYYYRPKSSRCHLDDADVFMTEAQVSLSQINTTGKYPEYHKVWKDGVLEVVAIFGKYEEGATSPYDAGISAYNEFVRKIAAELEPHGATTTPAEYPASPGVEVPEIVFQADLGSGRQMRVTCMLVDSIRSADAAFNARYADLSSSADLIAYNGHSGLGANIRALARKGHWVEGQYAIVFMNGCDTYAYVDTALADAHAAVNPDDEVGTKYVDLVMNAMPAFFREDATATMALVRGLMNPDEPISYEQIFMRIDSSQVVLVSGEQDNEYQPGFDGGGENPPVWEGMQETGRVTKDQEVRYNTPLLPKGKYLFQMTGDGDADLYVRVGQDPDTRYYDCRPYSYNSHESCEVELSSPAEVHLMVRGWEEWSEYSLSGQPQ